MPDHLIGLLLGAEEDWPQAFEAILGRVGQGRALRREHPHLPQRAADHRAVRPDGPGAHRARHRPPGLLVLPPARVAEEGRHGQRDLPAQQPVHLPVDGEALGVLRHAAARPEGATHDPGALQEPRRQRPLGLHRQEVQPALRPRQDRRRARLPDVHEALRRRRLAGRLADQQPRRPPQGLRRVRRDAHAPPGDHRLRALRPGAVDRPRDDGDEVPARRADAQPVRRLARLPQREGRHRDGRDLADRQRLLRLGVQLLRDAGPGDEVYPIDYANACPDVAVTSLHYYFPWAITALVRWSVFTLATGRKGRVDLHTRRYFEIADDESLSYDAKVTAYLALADEHFDTATLLAVVRREPPAPRRAGPRLGHLAGLRAAAARDGRGDVPGSRAGLLHGPLQGPHRPLGGRQQATSAG